MLTKITTLALFFLPLCINAKHNLQATEPLPGSNTTTTLPPSVISKCYGELQYGIVTISWKTYDPDTSSIFYIERSENGKDFTELGKVENEVSLDAINFSFRDNTPLPTGFYRIKTIANDDTLYSDIIRLSSLSGMTLIKVTPLIFDVQITVEVNSKINEDLTIALSNSEGKILSSRLINTEKGLNKVVFDDAISFLYADEYTMSVTGVKYAYNQKLYKK